MFHYLFPPLSIGLGLQLFLCELMYFRTRDLAWESAARFWTRVFAVNFGLGVASGIVMEFEFGTNWAAYSRFVGDVFGSALAAEGIDPAELSDVGAEALRALAEEKARQGQDVVDTEVAADADEDTDEGGGGDVVDIVDLLRERLGGQTNAAPKLSELTKSELYERAKRRGIEGRSGMSKDQLVDALAS